MFELESMTKVRVLDVRVLAAKDRKPDDPPGGQMLLKAQLGAGSLTMFDGGLRSWLFRKSKSTATGQEKLEGMEGDELTSIGDHVKRFRWDYEQTGCTIEIDHGTGGKSNLVLADCKVHRILLSPRQGGAVEVQWTIDAPGLSPATWAKLPGMKATEIQMTMAGPKADDAQGEIVDELTPKRGRGRPPKATDATDEFVRRNQAAAAGAH
jgi:hypothetical protein